MANTVKTTNRTIEVSAIDSDYMMDTKLNVQSVVMIPGGALKGSSKVYIVENSEEAIDPVKALLVSSIGETEPRGWMFNQRLQLGFVYADGVFNTGCKVIFNIGELHNGNCLWTTNMKMKMKAEDAIL